MVIDIPSWLGTYFFWFPTWAQSPGFAGVFAVVAASIALIAARQTAKTNRAIAEREQWWVQAEYALNLALKPAGPSQDVGFSLLRALIDRTTIEADMFLLTDATARFLTPADDEVNLDDIFIPVTDNEPSGGASDDSVQ